MTRRLMVPLGRVGLGVAAVTAAAVLSACSHPRNAASSAPSNPPSASAAASASPAAASPPSIVGVTTGGALVTLNPTTGAVVQTLVPSGVTGDEVSVAPNGMVFFMVKNGCGSNIEQIPMSGGSAALVAPGSAPAVSPDGTKLAYASQPQYGAPPDCQVASPDLDEWFQLKVRTLSNGATVTLPAVPSARDSGLPHPISSLSWSADNTHVAVSIWPPQDNDGYQINLVDTVLAQYFVAGVGVVTVPVTGSPAHTGTVLGAATYLPDGNLFVSRFCCEGVPVTSISSLMWEVKPSGAFVHQVAIGNPAYSHSSLDATTDGRWLLYVAHTVDAATLYVSEGGATPRALTTGIFTAAWT